MLTFIDGRLKDWAMWRAGAGGKGYDCGSAPCAGEPLSYVPVNDLECAQVDACVCALQPVLRQAVEEAYLRIGTTDDAARKCGCSRMTLWRRLDEAHNRILGYLNDLAAGVEVIAWDERARAMGVAPSCLTI